MQHVPGPGFSDGRASSTARVRSEKPTRPARASCRYARAPRIEVDKKSGRSSIIVSEIPYQVNKARLLERIAELVNEKRIEGIYDLRDESDRQRHAGRRRAPSATRSPRSC